MFKFYLFNHHHPHHHVVQGVRLLMICSDLPSRSLFKGRPRFLRPRGL